MRTFLIFFFISLSSISAMPLPQTIFFPLASAAIPLPQINGHTFFFLYFVNAIATNQLQQFFFPSYFGNAIATNSFPLFPPYFSNDIATNQLEQFFFSPPISAMPLPQFHSTNFFFFLRNDMCTQFLSDKLLLLD